MRRNAALATFSASAFAAAALAPGAAQALVITTGCASASSCTLEELFAGGAIQIEDKLFYGFADVSGAGVIGSAQVGEMTSTTLLGSGPGIQFSTGFFGLPVGTGDLSLSIVFEYSVSVVDAPLLISGASLHMGGVPGFAGIFGDGTFTSITQTLFADGSQLAENYVFFDIIDGILVENPDSAEFAPQDSLRVQTSILLERLDLDSDSFIRLGGFVQRFPQTPIQPVPEPHAALLFGAGALLTLRALRGRRELRR
jgi:hypothetical protein